MTFEFEKDPTFCEIVHLVINSEGGYVNHPRDKGGPTKYGIAWNYNSGYLKSQFSMNVPTDVQKLTWKQAQQLYYDRYWLPSGAKGITDVDLAYIHFDCAVNAGVGRAALCLSRLSKDPRHYDGAGGKNRTLFMSLFLEYTAQRLRFYASARDRDVFLAGWVNRMAEVIQNSLTLD